MTEGEIVWKKEFGIGVEEIDKAHENLFAIVRRLHALNLQKESQAWGLEEGIKYLKIYTKQHFQQEEAYMRSIEYPHLDEHMAQHAALRDKVLPQVEMRLAQFGHSPEAMEKFLEVMNQWLTHHILVHDKRIGLQTRNIEPADLKEDVEVSKSRLQEALSYFKRATRLFR